MNSNMPNHVSPTGWDATILLISAQPKEMKLSHSFLPKQMDDHDYRFYSKVKIGPYSSQSGWDTHNFHNNLGIGYVVSNISPASRMDRVALAPNELSAYYPNFPPR
jgi:hypothetical protein